MTTVCTTSTTCLLQQQQQQQQQQQLPSTSNGDDNSNNSPSSSPRQEEGERFLAAQSISHDDDDHKLDEEQDGLDAVFTMKEDEEEDDEEEGEAKEDANVFSSLAKDDTSQASTNQGQETRRASQVYLEASASPILRCQQQNSTVEYKSKVQRLIQQMEEQQKQALRDQDAKSLEFRRRMDQFWQENTAAVRRDKTEMNAGVYVEGSHHEQQQQVEDGKSIQKKPHHTSCNQTDATRSISVCSWSIDSVDSRTSITPKNSQDEDEEDEVQLQQHEVHGQQENSNHDRPHQLQVVHVQQKQKQDSLNHYPPATPSTLASTTASPLFGASTAATSSTSAQISNPQLQERLAHVESQLAEFQVENTALRALRLSYKHRFAFEQQQRRSLVAKVETLQQQLQQATQQNQDLQQRLDGCLQEARHAQTRHTAQEETWRHKKERVQRDFDKLWKQHKALIRKANNDRFAVCDLQQQLGNAKHLESKWNEEKQFLKEKVKQMQEQIQNLKTAM